MCLAVKYLPRFQTIYVSYSYLFSRSVWGMTEEYWYLIITVQRLAIFHRPRGVQLCLRVSGVHWCPLVSLLMSFLTTKRDSDYLQAAARPAALNTRAAVPDTSTNLSWADRKQKGFILQWAEHAGTKCAAQTLTSEISRQTLVSRSPQKHLELITIKWLVKNVSVL